MPTSSLDDNSFEKQGLQPSALLSSLKQPVKKKLTQKIEINKEDSIIDGKESKLSSQEDGEDIEMTDRVNELSHRKVSKQSSKKKKSPN